MQSSRPPPSASRPRAGTSASGAPGPDSMVEFDIAGHGGASDLKLVQSGFGDDEDGRRARLAYQRGWGSCLNVLRSLLEDEPKARLAPALMHRDIPMPGHE